MTLYIDITIKGRVCLVLANVMALNGFHIIMGCIAMSHVKFFNLFNYWQVH